MPAALHFVIGCANNLNSSLVILCVYNTYLTHPLARTLVAPCTDRIHALELPEVVDMLAAGKRDDLLQVEQLGIEMRAGNVFAGFSESPIT
jgi:hypothetical protein